MKKFLSYAVAFALISAAAAACIPSAFAEDSSETADNVKILPLGDSITDGYQSAGGYRKYLSRELNEMGMDFIDLVGPKGSNSETYDGFQYDGNHAGYSGYAIQKMTSGEYREGLLEMVQGTWYDGGKSMIASYEPDIVLLQIGTNDILSGYNEGITDRLENLARVISEDMNDPGDVIFISTIPYIDAVLRADWLGAYGINAWTSTDEEKAQLQITVQECIDNYNASIKELTAELKKQGLPVEFADVNSLLDYKTDLEDGVHPNETGYEKMGSYWAEIIADYISRSEPLPTEPDSEPETTESDTEPETTEPDTEPETTEPDTEPETTEPIKDFCAEDIVRLSRWLLRQSESEITAENCMLYDLDDSGVLDSFDLVLLRKAVVAKNI